MNRRILALPLLALILTMVSSPVGAQHGATETLGAVSFPVSCHPRVGPAFERAVALLHSFGYDLARDGFEAVVADDPTCAMAEWGVAMSWYHPLWAPPTPAEFAAGRAAVGRAQAIGGKNERENAWIAAIATFYDDAAGVDPKTRAPRYRDAMAKLTASAAPAPADADEASIFYALSILGAAPPGDPTRAQQRLAADRLLPLVAKLPRHPGLTHYIIHAYDYPDLAVGALDAARRYARIAPSSAHALHMPSHIFVRLGLWPETIASNLDSAASAKALAARFPASAIFDALHALDYLAYAYLQQGRESAARAVLAEASDLAARAGENDMTFASAYASAAIPARLALERDAWREAASLPLSLVKGGSSSAVDERYPYAPAITWFARAVGAARSGDLTAAEAALSEIASRQARLAAAPPPGPYDWAGAVEVQRLAASGWISRARGNNEEAVRLLRDAALAEERTGKHPVTPGSVLPAREQLGDLLLELDKPREALAEYEAELLQTPSRLRSIRGAAKAAALAGEAERARTFTNLIAALTGGAGDGTGAGR